MSVVSPPSCFRISKPCSMAQRAEEIGNGKLEMGMQVMKTPIPPCSEVTVFHPAPKSKQLFTIHPFPGPK